MLWWKKESLRMVESWSSFTMTFVVKNTIFFVLLNLFVYFNTTSQLPIIFLSGPELLSTMLLVQVIFALVLFGLRLYALMKNANMKLPEEYHTFKTAEMQLLLSYVTLVIGLFLSINILQLNFSDFIPIQKSIEFMFIVDAILGVVWLFFMGFIYYEKDKEAKDETLVITEQELNYEKE